MARLAGGLWVCFVYLSLSGGSLLLHPSPLPLKDNVVFPPCLDVVNGASWWAQTQVCGNDAVVVEGECQSVDALPPFSASCFSLWVAGVLGLDFRGMALMGRISARRGKRQFEVQRRSSVSYIVKHIVQTYREAYRVGLCGVWFGLVWFGLFRFDGQYFILGALCPSKSGLMNKHIVKHIVFPRSGG